MEIVIRVNPPRTESKSWEEIDSFRCPKCQSLRYWISEEGVGYCAQCDCAFINVLLLEEMRRKLRNSSY